MVTSKSQFAGLVVFLVYLYTSLYRALLVAAPSFIVIICNCQVSVTFTFKCLEVSYMLSWKLLVFDKLWTGQMIHTHWPQFEVGNSQERFIANRKWFQGVGSVSGNGLKQNKPAAIPLVNERVDVVRISIVRVSKSEECLTIVAEGLHIKGIICLERLEFDKAVTWPFVYIGLDRIALIVASSVCKNK